MNIFNTEFQLEMHYITIVLLNEIYVCNGLLYTPNTPNAVNKGLELETNVFSYKSSHLHKHFMCTVKNCH